MEITTTDCYLPVDAKERLPEKDGYYISYIAGEWEEHPFAERQFWLDYDWENEVGNTFEGFNISHWLEKKTGMIVLTVEQFNKIIKEKEDEAWTDGWCAGNKKT